MPRAKFQTLTEQMFYILLCLKNECCGTDIMEKIKSITDGRIILGPGTLYNLLEQFVTEEIIIETKTEGRRRSYILTEKGKQILEIEVEEMHAMLDKDSNVQITEWAAREHLGYAYSNEQVFEDISGR